MCDLMSRLLKNALYEAVNPLDIARVVQTWHWTQSGLASFGREKYVFISNVA